MLAPWKKSCDKPRQRIKKQRHHFDDKGLYSQNYGFSSSHVRMWELGYKEGWAQKNWCCWTVLLEKTWKSLGEQGDQTSQSKGNQPWIFIGRTDAEAEVPVFLPPDMKSQLIRKDPDVGKDWGQEEKGVTEDEMVRWHHWFSGHECEQIPGDSEGQCAADHGSPKSWTWLSDWTTTKIVCGPNEKAFITHLSYFIFLPSLVKVLWLGKKVAFHARLRGNQRYF